MKSLLLVALFALTLAAQTPRPVVTRVDGAQALSLIAKEARCADPDQRIQGTVNVLVTISADGKLEDAVATKGPAALRQAALDCVAKWTFRPLISNGTAKRASADYDVVFKLR